MFPVVDAGLQFVACAQLQPEGGEESGIMAYARGCSVSFDDDTFSILLDQAIAEKDLVVLSGISADTFYSISVNWVNERQLEVVAFDINGDLSRPPLMMLTFCRMNNAQLFEASPVPPPPV